MKYGFWTPVFLDFKHEEIREVKIIGGGDKITENLGIKMTIFFRGFLFFDHDFFSFTNF
jgi:hypothetical protein